MKPSRIITYVGLATMLTTGTVYSQHKTEVHHIDSTNVYVDSLLTVANNFMRQAENAETLGATSNSLIYSNYNIGRAQYLASKALYVQNQAIIKLLEMKK